LGNISRFIDTYLHLKLPRTAIYRLSANERLQHSRQGCHHIDEREWKILRGVIMSVETMEELFVDELKDLYSAEKQITRALPKLAKAASSEELKTALLSHLEETNGQIERLEQIFKKLGKSPKGKTCAGMKGVLEEGSEVLEDTDSGTVRDAALIAAAQRVEHYEMAGYGSAREFAKLLGQNDAASLLDETLAEEKAADSKLSNISREINKEAVKAA
jgi:ferritin-like metal-binding protein YciE